MKYLYVIDPAVAAQLIEIGCRILYQQFDIEQAPIWVFEYDPEKHVCFDINDTSVRRACAVSDSLTMRF